MESAEKFVVLKSGEDNTISITDGLPKLEKGVLIEIPKDPHTFKVNELKARNDKGEVINLLYDIRVVLAHGRYDQTDHQLKFLDGQPVKDVVQSWNEQNQTDPIAFVVVCSGDQVPIGNVGGEDLFLGSFTYLEDVAFAQGTNVNVDLVRQQDGQISIGVKSEIDSAGGFINLDKLDPKYGLASRIRLND